MGQEVKPTIYLDTVGEAKGRHIALNDGGWPYLWIGDNRLCYGCIPDNEVRALRDMCNAIIKTRQKPKRKGKVKKPRTKAEFARWVKQQSDDWFCRPVWLAPVYRKMLHIDKDQIKDMFTRDRMIDLLKH